MCGSSNPKNSKHIYFSNVHVTDILDIIGIFDSYLMDTVLKIVAIRGTRTHKSLVSILSGYEKHSAWRRYLEGSVIIEIKSRWSFLTNTDELSEMT